ncbi:butyrate kinase [Neptunicoccus cionae]|uniref:butyrate kinase n=1 Tax=Neptunicoccus cionae TaxID=2035344 RepID=UPI000C77BE95|nr:butyrate kinase [Amylibacter cionae]PLS22592.1 butyrate kinase [Amylibacter cionae]
MLNNHLILTINPGTTTTRLGLYRPDDGKVFPVQDVTIEHDETRMAGFATVSDQLEFRARAIAGFLRDQPDGLRLAAVAGRGGMLSPVPAGVIEVNEALVNFALHRPLYAHASNLGAPLARAIAAQHGVRAFIVDPVSVDELPEVARISGFPEIPRFSFLHALNIRACGRRFAAELDKPFERLNAVVVHLGAGISVAALKQGRIVESTNRMENAPFSPERAGGLPVMPLIDLCYSGKYSQSELKRKLYGNGGVFAYLGTKDMRQVEAMIESGDSQAALVFEAMLYQIRKAIGAMAAVLDFAPDGIILTGGMAHSDRITGSLTQGCGTIAPVRIYAGSYESEALAAGAARVLAGQEAAMHWPIEPDTRGCAA